jgi:hypothetical protein
MERKRMTKTDGIHENFFAVPELPHKKKEREAILFCKLIIQEIQIHGVVSFRRMQEIFNENKEIFDWIMKYKGE